MNQGTMVDLQTALNLALTLIAFFGGWFLRTIKEDIKDLKRADENMGKALNDLRVDLPSHYVNKADFKQMGDSIFEALRRIEDKLDNKADKDQS